jgi:hypothetical protein
MKTSVLLLIFVALGVAEALEGQQAATPQPTQAQEQPAPCVTTPTNPKSSGNNPTFKIPSGWRQKIAAKTGITLPDVPTGAAQSANPKPVPCPPPVTAPKTPQPFPAKLPPDMTLTLHCTPLPPKDANGHQSTLILPNPNDFASPKPSDILADSVQPDLSAKTGCWQVKVDPVTKKSFIAQ